MTHQKWVMTHQMGPDPHFEKHSLRQFCVIIALKESALLSSKTPHHKRERNEQQLIYSHPSFLLQNHRASVHKSGIWSTPALFNGSEPDKHTPWQILKKICVLPKDPLISEELAQRNCPGQILPLSLPSMRNQFQAHRTHFLVVSQHTEKKHTMSTNHHASHLLLRSSTFPFCAICSILSENPHGFKFVRSAQR